MDLQGAPPPCELLCGYVNLSGGLGVPSSNLGAPTIRSITLSALGTGRGAIRWRIGNRPTRALQGGVSSMGMKQTLDVINKMEADGIIGRHAIAGAVAAYNYVEPTVTNNLGILVSFHGIPGEPQSG